MATALCLSFFPEGLLRIALLTLLFPLLSLALCAWMTVFGFYLRRVPYLCAFYPPWSLPRPGILPEFQFRFVTLTRPDILPAYWNLTRIIISDSLIKYFNLSCCNVLMG